MQERSYGYKPRPRFFGDGTAFLGVELEVEAPDSVAKQRGLQDAGDPNWCYVKRDGSLGEHGLEFVTHPISISLWMTRGEVRDYHRLTPGQALQMRYKGVQYSAVVAENGTSVTWTATDGLALANPLTYGSISACASAIQGGRSVNGYRAFGLTNGRTAHNPASAFYHLAEQLRRLNYTSHDNERCGFHIHVSRTAFEGTSTGRDYNTAAPLDKPSFFRFKTLVNGLLFRKISQRNNFRYCEQTPVDPNSFWQNNYNRYEAVNVTNHTAEVRIFRGNLRESRIRKNVEAVIAAIEWSNTATDMTPANDDAFAEFVAANRDRFPDLHEFISNLDR